MQRSDVVAGVCTAGVTALVVFLSVHAVLQGLIAGALIGYAVAVLRSKYIAVLRQRVRANDSQEWDVEINSVKVGTVSDATYAAIRLQVFEDIRLYVAQFLNCGWVLMRVLESMLLSIPIIAFWSVLVFAIFSPGSCTEVLNYLRDATPESIAKFSSSVFNSMMSLGLLVAGVQAKFTGYRYGFVNRFGEATENALRLHLGIATEGKFALVQYVDGVPHFNEELATLRRN